MAGWAVAQEPAPRPGDDEPLLRLEAGGPTTLVTSMAFGPDGRTFYEAGWDKVVRVWVRDEASGALVPDSRATYRVPIGPGLDGAINAMALSPDGNWLAVAGNGVVRHSAGFRSQGLVVPMEAISDDMRRDQGTIYVFSTRERERTSRVLRGHLGPVYALSFAPTRPGAPPVLLSAGSERVHDRSVRLWNAETGEYLGGIMGPRDARTRPGLAIWRTGDGPKQVRAAVAWEDEKLRVWDPSRDGTPPATVLLPDGLLNNTVAVVGDRSLLLSGCLNLDPTRGPLDGHGLIRGWDLAGNEGPRLDARWRLSFPPMGTVVETPRALVAFSSKAGGPVDRAAVILRRIPDRNAGVRGEYSLVLVEIGDGGLRALGPRTALWPDEGIMPALAVDPTGRYLAVSGNRERDIRIFAIPDLLQGGATPQRLRGDGTTMRRVAVVKKGENWGVLLNAQQEDQPGEPPRSPGPGDQILDVAARRLRSETDGWAVSAPSLGPWRVTVEPLPQGGAAPASVLVGSGDGQEARITLKPNQVVTATALLPPGPPLGRPLVAIAFEEIGEPNLGVYDGVTGELVRRFTGHAERIDRLAFSEDGRLLVSAGEDRTVCVWSLTDLKETWGKLRLFQGVAAIQKDGRLVVTGIESDQVARYHGDLREGDVLQGFVDKGTLRPLTTFQELKEALAAVAPGQSVMVRRVREANAVKDLAIPVVQGADERKPLFFLFVTQSAGDRGPGWIGWSPLGPYETSDQSVEQRLGWHFNTGKPQVPASFAMADQYRKKFYREGLLRDLLDHGTLVPPPAPPPVPRPNMSLYLEPQGDLDGRGMVLVRQAPSTLGLMVSDRRIAPEQIASVQWQVDGSPLRDLPNVDDGMWAAEVSQPAWGRGLHRARVVLRTNELVPQEFQDERLIRVQPPAATIDAKRPQRPIVVEEPEWRFQAVIDPVGGPASARLVRRIAGGERVEKRWEGISERQHLDERLALDEGANAFELIVVNDGALKDFEEAETARLAWTVISSRKPVPPPDIVLSRVTPLSGAGETEPSLPIEGGGPIVVSGPQVRVEGRIVGEKPLSKAERLEGEAVTGQPLERFEADRAPTFDLSELIELSPGPKTYRFRARASDSEFAETRLTIDFRPRVPEVRELALDRIEPIVYGEPEGPSPTVGLSARLIPPRDRHPFQAAILVNEEEQPEAPEINEAATLLTSTVSLKPGGNQIKVRVSNAWGSTWTTEAVYITYLRPPKIRGVARPTVGDQPLVDLSATLESPDDLPPTRAKVEVDGGEGGPETVVDNVPIRREGNGWVLQAKNVPLFEGENTLRVWAWNADGRSREPGLVRGLTYRRPPPPKPELSLQPEQDATVRKTKQPVTFHVESKSPLRRVELTSEGPSGNARVLFHADVESVSKSDQGTYEVSRSIDVALERGANHLRLVAVNSGGESSATRILSYVPPPVRVVIDAIAPKAGKGPAVAPRMGADNAIEFTEPVSDGRAWMSGRVIWPDEESLRIEQATRLNVWVNGFPQSFATLRTRREEPLEREFQVAIALSRRQNHVEIELPDLPREAGDRPEFTVGCERPDERQRLHMLIIGVGPMEANELRAKAIQALQGTLVENSTERFQTPAFPEGIIYGPLCGDVREWRVRGELVRIRNAIRRRRNAPDAPNEVVLVYYRGGEWITKDRATHLRLRTGEGGDSFDTIPVDALVTAFRDTPAAKVFLLDVTRPSGASPTPLDPRVGLLRSAWRSRGATTTTSELPEESWLITSLEVATARASTLGDVASEMSRRYSSLKERFPDLDFDSDYPPALSTLIIGTR